MYKHVIVDIDGTIADCTHRLKFIKGEVKDWTGFYNACIDDKPIQSMIDMVRALNERHYYIIFLTGRSEVARDLTYKWLSEHVMSGFDKDYLLMRPRGDYREDSVVKLELLKKHVENSKAEVSFILEDRQTVVNAYRAEGFKVLQVAEGNF